MCDIITFYWADLFCVNPLNYFFCLQLSSIQSLNIDTGRLRQGRFVLDFLNCIYQKWWRRSRFRKCWIFNLDCWCACDLLLDTLMRNHNLHNFLTTLVFIFNRYRITSWCKPLSYTQIQHRVMIFIHHKWIVLGARCCTNKNSIIHGFRRIVNWRIYFVKLLESSIRLIIVLDSFQGITMRSIFRWT